MCKSIGMIELWEWNYNLYVYVNGWSYSDLHKTKIKYKEHWCQVICGFISLLYFSDFFYCASWIILLIKINTIRICQNLSLCSLNLTFIPVGVLVSDRLVGRPPLPLPALLSFLELFVYMRLHSFPAQFGMSQKHAHK